MKVYSVSAFFGKEWIIEDRGKYDFRIYEHDETVGMGRSFHLFGQYQREEIKRLVDKLNEILHDEEEGTEVKKECIPSMKSGANKDISELERANFEKWHREQHRTKYEYSSCLSAYIPGLGTVRECAICGCLLAGGVTKCNRCAKEGFSEEIK